MDKEYIEQQISKLQTDFNGMAQKIISDSEFKAKLKVLYKAELSFGEKVLLNIVEKPATLVGAIKTGVRLAINKDLKWSFLQAAGDYSRGFYEDGNGKTYINTGVMHLLAAEDIRFSPTKRLTIKTHQLGLKAAEQCQDHSAEYSFGGNGKLRAT